MASPRDKRLLRWFARRLGHEDLEVRTLQNLEQLRGVLRFGGLFGLLVILPTLGLAWLALSSLKAEELTVEADMEHAMEAAAGAVWRDVEAMFARFEAGTAERLTSGQSPLSSLSELSPYLRAAFRFDESGNLAAPFALPSPDVAPVPSTRYRALVLEARGLEGQGQFEAAAARYALAAHTASDPALHGEAELSRARALWRAGHDREAEELLADVYADHANVRDALGFRFGDLATLKRGEIALARHPEVGAVALQGLVEELLAARWTIGRPGESAVARRALTLLEGNVDPDWLGRARVRLQERSEQLFWAEKVVGELEALVNVRTSPGEFRYFARPGSGTLWSIVWWDGSLYAFSFDDTGVVERFDAAIASANALDPEVSTRIVQTDAKKAGELEARRSLSPWLPSLWVVAAPRAPHTLTQKKALKRRQRVLVILFAVGTAAVGVVFSVRLVNRELESARMKTDFAANVSHELRSPITQIRLKGEALQLELVFDESDRRAHYDAIVREAERLSRLVDNVLDFAAIERGAKRYTLRPDDPGEILWNAIEAGRANIEGQGMTLELDVPPDLPVIWCDREAVGQVFTNLLSNAAKYGAEGGWVGVRAQETEAGVEVSVADRGIGIAREELGRIFEHFYRSTDPKVRRRKGTGIGLTIVRYIVEEHGGTITVDSAPGHGTTFTVTFPHEPPEDTEHG